MRWLLALCACLSGFAAAPQPTNWVVLFQDDFETSANTWQVGLGEGAADTWQRVKEGNNTVYSGQGHVWLNLPGQNWGDYRFRSRIKLLQGGLHVNYRKRGCSRYFLSFNTGGLLMSRQAPDCTFGANPQGVSGSYSFGTWYEIEIVGIGGNLKVYVNGVLKMDYTDADPLIWGDIAFECLPDSRVMVDDVEVSGPASPLLQPWIKVGGPHGGIGYDVRMNPDNPDVMFATDVFSGVSKSTDGGRNWFSANQGITARAGPTFDAIPIFCVTIDPNNPQVVWAGTLNQRGIFKSTDGGGSWVEKTSGIVERSGISFRGISVDPNDSNTVYAAAEILSFTWAGQNMPGLQFDRTKGVVYRTRDGGDNWTAVWRGDNLARYVLIDPRNSSVIYVSTGIFDREAANSDLRNGVPGGVGVLKSTDGGLNWQALDGANGLQNLYVGSLAQHPRNPDILLAGTGVVGYAAGSGVFLSTDQGAHWQMGILAGSNRLVDEGITAVDFAASDPNIAYAASTLSFYRSEDGGHSWTVRAGGSPIYFYGSPGSHTGFPIDLQVDPRNPDRVFLNSYGGGNFLSDDGGRTWQIASRGYTGAQIHRIAVDPADAGHLYVVARSGPFRSRDHGDHWAGIGGDGPAGFPPWYTIALDPGNPNHVLLTGEHQGSINVSTDAGQHWHPGLGLPQVNPSGSPDSRHGLKALAFAPSNPRTIYAGMCRDRISTDSGQVGPSFGVYKSTDGGEHWVESNDALSSGQNINVLAVDPGREANVYAGTLAAGLLKSVDGGRTWQEAGQALRSWDVRAVALDPGNLNVLFAGLEKRGIYKSTDGGASWKSSAVGLNPQASIRDIVLDPTNAQTLFAADIGAGVYTSVDGGKLWTALTKGLSTRAVNALAISSDGGTLYAATEGEGVFRLDLKTRDESTLGTVSAASFAPAAPLAPESIAAMWGQGLADAVVGATVVPLPTALGGARVVVTDVNGEDRDAPLFFVSPGQINYLIPAGTAKGTAVVRVFRQGRVVARGTLEVESVAPALFTANASGSGVPAAVGVRVSGGVQTQIPVFQCGAAAGNCASAGVDLGPPGDDVILLLFGTGIRGNSGLAGVSVKIGGVDAEVAYAGAQGGFVGLDQVNVRLPRSLVGRGEVDLVLTVDGKTANTVRVRIN